MDKNGFLNFQELFNALVTVDSTVTQTTVNQFIRRLGITQEKFISFGEFVKGIAYNLKQSQAIISKDRPVHEPVHDHHQTAKLLEQLSDKQKAQAMRAFHVADVDGSGTISTDGK